MTSIGAVTFTPAAVRKSDEPLTLVTLRLPCFATATPAAAVTMAAAVLTLKIFEPVPPVPQVSTTTVRVVGKGVM